MRRTFVYFSLVVLLDVPVFSTAIAANVDFTTTLTNTCTLAVPTAGTLGLSSDGLTLGSEEGGLAATVTILSIGSNTVTFGAPTREVTPVGYNATGESIEIRYVGLGGLNGVNQIYTSLQSQFAVDTIPLTSVTVNARIQNPNGFPEGAYTVRTVVTCS